MGAISCPETSVNYHCSLRDNPDEQLSHTHTHTHTHTCVCMYIYICMYIPTDTHVIVSLDSVNVLKALKVTVLYMKDDISKSCFN